MEKAQTMSLMKNLEYLLQKVCPLSQVHISTTNKRANVNNGV
jgi:hypothetical protein